MKPTPASAGRRRTLFGLNTSIALAAAVGVIVALNWLVFWQYAATPPSVKRFVRYDLSATRAHSFSPQTKSVLAGLDAPHTLVAIFRDAGTPSELTVARRRNLEDLLEEYARTSRRITVRTVRAAPGSSDANDVARQVAQRFADETKPLQAQLHESAATLSALAGDLDRWQHSLDVLANAAYPAEGPQAQARGIANAMVRLRLKMLAAAGQTRQAASAPMPDYIRLAQTGYDTLADARDELTQCRTVLTRTLANQANRMEDRDLALNLAAKMQEAPDRCLRGAYALQNARVGTAYEQARLALDAGETLVVLSGKRARVVPIERLFRRVDDRLAKAGATLQDAGAEQFTGEEQITGALVSLSLSPAPRVVFLQSNAGPALTPANAGPDARPGLFQAMARRLRAMDFEVSETNACFGKNLDEDGTPADLAPPLPGQKTVWVLCPFIEPNPKNPASEKMDTRLQSCAFLQKQLSKGDSALVMLNHNPLPDPARVKVAEEALGKIPYDRRHPVCALLKRHGIDAHLWEDLAHEEQAPGMQPVPARALVLQHYPADMSVSRAVEGLALSLDRPIPLLPARPAPAGVAVHPIVTVTRPGLYTWGYDTLHNGGPQGYNPATALPYAVLAMASQGPGPTRLVAVGDPLWATDVKTTFGYHPQLAPGGAAGMADVPGGVAAWPGNAELFVNSICWLAHLDNLVAPGARSQDVRRIMPAGGGLATGLRLLLLFGLPLGIGLTGIGVWVVRKKF